MRKNVLFIAKFDNILKGMNTILAKNFNMQMCPPEPAMVEKTLDVMEMDLILLYISGLPFMLLSSLCDKLRDVCRQTPLVVFGTAEECEEFDGHCPIPISKYMYRPLSAQDITRSIFELFEGASDIPQEKQEVEPKPEVKSDMPLDMSLADFADLLEADEPESDERRCILLVDDDGRILRAIKMLLEDKYKINLANSGMRALESIERERPDAVLLDYEMPMMDGKQTLEMIRNNKKTHDLPVFFLTGVADKEKIRDVVHLKPQGYLLKSSEQSAIIEMLEKHFASNK